MSEKDFNFTAITWKDVTNKVNFQVIEELLNEKLTLSNYGEAVKSMYCTFLAIQLNNPIHDEYVEYDKQEQFLDVAVKLDMRLLKDSTKATTLEIMAKSFSEYILQYPSIEGFDSKGFYEEVKSAFVHKGWLEISHVLTLSEKAAITGLEETAIHLIETDINKVALGRIKTYCQKLEVDYQELMPELFSRVK